jgi:5-methyltetrahydrofolate--homocysteine methyltransferase
MQVTSLIDDLIAEAPVLTDGAWGTELQRRGLPAGEIGDLWNLSHPEHVGQVARAYVDAGSRIILTNTFRANRIVLQRCREESNVEEINRAGVAISRRAAAGRALVFASIGPTGKMLMTGEVDEAQLKAAFSEQSDALAAAGADGLVVETMADLVEARIAVSAAAATGLPVVACMVFDAGKHRDRTIMGVAPQTAAVELTEAGAQVIGANCGIGVEAYIPICAALASATDRPIWIKPNAGLPEFVGGGFVYRMTAEQFAGHAPALINAGARFIGGCCGTTPEFIAALRRRLSPVEPLNR